MCQSNKTSINVPIQNNDNKKLDKSIFQFAG